MKAKRSRPYLRRAARHRSDGRARRLAGVGRGGGRGAFRGRARRGAGRDLSLLPWNVILPVGFVLVVAALVAVGLSKPAAETPGVSAAVAGLPSSLLSQGDSASAAKDISVTAEDLDRVPQDQDIAVFDLGDDASSPTLGVTQTVALRRALADIADEAAVSVVLVDAGTGRGIAYDAAHEVYGASSYKAPFALYVCENLVETGRASLTDALSGNGDGQTSGSVQGLIQNALVWSSNEAYRTLRATYNGIAYQRWCESLGVEDAPADEGWFPTYSAKTSAKAWCEMAAYLEFHTDTSDWLKGLLGKTQVSFIRDGLKDTGATVYNKAGWVAGEQDTSSTSDAALIEMAGSRYVMSIMSGLPYSNASAAKVAALARALFAARGALA